MSPEFEGRGGDEANAQLSATVRNVLMKNTSLDWKSLCITTGQTCWILYVDALVLDSSGNLFDALTIATKAALYNTKYGVKCVINVKGYQKLRLQVQELK